MGTRTAVHGCISIFIIFHCMQTIVRRMVPAVECRPTAVLYVVCPMKVAQKKELLVSFLALRSDVMLGVCSVHILPCDVVIFFSCGMCTALFSGRALFFFFLFFFPLFLFFCRWGGEVKCSMIAATFGQESLHNGVSLPRLLHRGVILYEMCLGNSVLTLMPSTC